MSDIMSSTSTGTIVIDGKSYPIVARKGAWTTYLKDGVNMKARVKGTKPTKSGGSKAKKKAATKTTKAKSDKLVEADLTKYTVSTKIKTASNRASVDNGDTVGKMLRGLSLEDVYRLAAEHTEETMVALHKKYDHLNPGMQRMNLGNRIRGALS